MKLYTACVMGWASTYFVTQREATDVNYFYFTILGLLTLAPNVMLFASFIDVRRQDHWSDKPNLISQMVKLFAIFYLSVM